MMSTGVGLPGEEDSEARHLGRSTWRGDPKPRQQRLVAAAAALDGQCAWSSFCCNLVAGKVHLWSLELCVHYVLELN
jgi:hypothetical protein